MKRCFVLFVWFSMAGFGQMTDSTVFVPDTALKVRKPLLPDEGIARFLVDVDNGYFEILVNDSVLMKRYLDTLASGHYKAVLWSPGYRPLPFEFDVEAGKMSTYNLKPYHNDKQKEFELAYREYRRKFHLTLTLPACLTLGNAMISTGFMIAAFDIRKKIEADLSLYSQAAVSSEVYAIKDEISRNNKKYNLYRSIFYAGSGFSAAFLATTFYTAIRFKNRNKEPVFIDQSPWHDRFSFSATPFGCRLQFNFG